MKISEIKPYENNARYNKKAIPVVAESIKEFGFLGQIVLQSRENPVIVTGHTRVEACKLLKWSEIPDKNIAFADCLTEEQIKAYRLADNRTGEISTWNKARLRSEVNALNKKKFDMSKFNFDFKSKIKPYGAERFKTDEHYNLPIVNTEHTGGKFDMPIMKVCKHVPKSLIPFNYAMSSNDYSAGIHFFIDDYQFERLWNRPKQYLKLLKKFDCVLTPDFSLYLDMPLPMQQWNEYRRRALGNYWQRNGIKVIPTLSWSIKDSFGFCFDGLPKNGTYAVSSVGVAKDKDSKKLWFEGMEYAIQKLKPTTILLYGSDIGFEFDCNVVNIPANTSFKKG